MHIQLVMHVWLKCIRKVYKICIITFTIFDIKDTKEYICIVLHPVSDKTCKGNYKNDHERREKKGALLDEYS